MNLKLQARLPGAFGAVPLPTLALCPWGGRQLCWPANNADALSGNGRPIPPAIPVSNTPCRLRGES
ncbi:MAG: hypothetical protein GXC94_15465 [Comamonadaceae bacterium]|nr:hypothetical protein [Comamonadaceae bacterium]